MSFRESCNGALPRSPGGTFAAADIAREIRFWRQAEAAPAFLTGHDHQVWALALSADADRLVSGDRAGLVRLWDTATGKPMWERQTHGGAVWWVGHAPDGMRVYAASEEEVEVLNAQTGAVAVEYRVPRGELTRASLSPDGKRLATTTTAGQVLILSTADMRSL